MIPVVKLINPGKINKILAAKLPASCMSPFSGKTPMVIEILIRLRTETIRQ